MYPTVRLPYGCVSTLAFLVTAMAALPAATAYADIHTPEVHAGTRALNNRAMTTAPQDSTPWTLRMTARPTPTKDSQGNIYVPASGFEGGWYSGDILRDVNILNTTDDVLLRPEWTNSTGWHYSVPNGTYDVTLRLRDGYAEWPGERVFDVSAQGRPVYKDLDVFAEVGRNVALNKTFRVQVSDGALNLKFQAKAGWTAISALIVKQVSASDFTATPSPTPTPSPAPTPSPPPSSPRPPSAASAAGFARLAFSDDFNTLDTIDLTGRGDPSKKWFTDRPFGWGRTDAQSLSVADGKLTINQTTPSPNYGIGTTSPTSKAGSGFQYGYFEASIAFDPKYMTTSAGWPSFWGVSSDQIKGAEYARTSEIDFFEAYHDPYEAFSDVYAGTVHDALITPKYVDRGNYGTNWVHLKGMDWKSFHTYGCLWEPGKVTWFMDGKSMLSQAYSASAAPVPNPTNMAVGSYTPLDTDKGGQTVILGTGVGFPMTVDWVRVWQR